MENCSSANSDPRTSGGLISAIYKGESVLCGKKDPLNVSNGATRKAIPESANTNATNSPSGRDLRQGACPRL